MANKDWYENVSDDDFCTESLGALTVKADLKELGLVWAEAECIARDCEKWKSDVLMAWCSSRDDEDELEGVSVSVP